MFILKTWWLHSCSTRNWAWSPDAEASTNHADICVAILCGADRYKVTLSKSTTLLQREVIDAWRNVKKFMENGIISLKKLWNPCIWGIFTKLAEKSVLWKKLHEFPGCFGYPNPIYLSFILKLFFNFFFFFWGNQLNFIWKSSDTTHCSPRVSYPVHTS